MRIRIKTQNQVFNHETDSDVVTIGRSGDNDFVIPLEDFSRKHCQITAKGEYLFIMDLGSKNGVMLDGKRIPPKEQFPVYKNTRILIANHFECILFEEVVYKEEMTLNLNIEQLPNRKLR